MGQFVPRQFDDILERMINRVVARTDLNDINDGSSLKQVLAAAAREDDDQYYQMINLLDLFDIAKVIGVDLDERAKEFNPSLISRTAAQKATGEVQFSRTGTVGTVTIAIGTEVEVPASGAAAPITFITTEEGTISGGSSVSNLVDVTAAKAGVEGNASVGTVTGFVSKPSGVDFVTNPASFTNGLDLESDDAFRQRLLNQLKGLARAHVAGIETAALTAVDAGSGKRVVFAQVVEDYVNLGNVTVYIDDGAGTAESSVVVAPWADILNPAVGGETVLFVPNKPIDTSGAFNIRVNAVLQSDGVHYSYNPASGQINLLPLGWPDGLSPGDIVTGQWTYFDGLIAECQKIIDGDPNDRSNYPGYRAAGVLIRVLAPTISQQVVTANITVLQGYDQESVAAEVITAVSSYINALGIGEDVILNELRERSMAVVGVFDIEFTSPTENVVILENYLARVLAANISIS
jgi:uncharacterized phage protein gp47/JayE